MNSIFYNPDVKRIKNLQLTVASRSIRIESLTTAAAFVWSQAGPTAPGDRGRMADDNLSFWVVDATGIRVRLSTTDCWK
jgi:hypothetical protein